MFDKTIVLQRILTGKIFRKCVKDTKTFTATQKKHQEYEAIYWINVKLKPEIAQIRTKLMLNTNSKPLQLEKNEYISGL